MKNFIQPGDTVSVPAPYAVASGVGCLVGSLFGVTNTAAAISAPVEIDTQGVFELAKATGQAWTVGARLYWDDTAKNLTTTAASNKLVAVALLAAGSGDTTGRALLTGAFTL